MKTVACLICGAVIGLPGVEHAVEGFQADLHLSLSCTAATYTALDVDATEADYDRAEKLCSAEMLEGRPTGPPL
jgi:hypothetical protein